MYITLMCTSTMITFPVFIYRNNQIIWSIYALLRAGVLCFGKRKYGGHWSSFIVLVFPIRSMGLRVGSTALVNVMPSAHECLGTVSDSHAGEERIGAEKIRFYLQRY